MNLDQFKNISDIFDLDKLPDNTKGNDLRFQDNPYSKQTPTREGEEYSDICNNPYKTSEYQKSGIEDDENKDNPSDEDLEQDQKKKFNKMVDNNESYIIEKKVELSNNDLLRMYANAEKHKDKKLMKQLENTMKGRKISI